MPAGLTADDFESIPVTDPDADPVLYAMCPDGDDHPVIRTPKAINDAAGSTNYGEH